MTMKAPVVERILDEHTQIHDDPTVREYILQVLLDDDAYDDRETLIETLQPLLAAGGEADEEECQALARELVESLIKEQGIGVEEANNQVELPLAPLFRNSTQLSPPLEPTPEAQGNSSHLVMNDDVINERLPKNKSTKREGRRQRKKKVGKEAKRTFNSVGDNEQAVEDDASAWRECQEQGVAWGGRGKGGRGEYSGAVNSVKSNIHLTNVSVSLDNGMDLLNNSTMDIVKGK